MKLLAIGLILILSGCAELKAVVGTYGAQASDEALSTALWTICNASPVGAHKRRFKTVEEIAAVRILCGDPE